MQQGKHQIAYISRVVYPSPAAHALQTIQMASAFACQTGDTHLFVRDLIDTRDNVRQQYGIDDDSPLRFWSLHANKLPSPIRRWYSKPNVYNSIMAGIFGGHLKWRGAKSRRRILFVRGLSDFMYWGLVKPYLWWTRNWVFVYEAHDAAGLDEKEVLEKNPFGLRKGAEGQSPQKILKALGNFDLILTVTQALADDLQKWTDKSIQPKMIRHASPLPRPQKFPERLLMGDEVVLGYVGTIDKYRGVDVLLKAMRFLPKNICLHLVGRIPDNEDAEWLGALLSDPTVNSRVKLIGHVPINQIIAEIDRCAIMLQPASGHPFTLRYASPLKSFDYMVRGKPIVAADVPCHRELYQDGINARLYQHDDEKHLAVCIQSLVEQPRQAEMIAKAAWEQAEEYSYDVRARRILELINEIEK